MLDQEAAFAQIQEAKTMVEEDLQRRLEEFEGEKEQLQKVAAAAASLEQQLEQASPPWPRGDAPVPHTAVLVRLSSRCLSVRCVLWTRCDVPSERPPSPCRPGVPCTYQHFVSVRSAAGGGGRVAFSFRGRTLTLVPVFQVKLALQQRDQQLEALRQEHLDLLKQLTCAQEALQARERALGDMQVRYDELQARLEELQEEAASRDDAIHSLQNEKIVLEVALQAARSGGEGLDRGAQRLAEGAEETSQVLEQLRQELAIKSSQVLCSLSFR